MDNTSDMDKPVSNAVSSAIQTLNSEFQEAHQAVMSAMTILAVNNETAHTEIYSAINTAKEYCLSEIEKNYNELERDVGDFFSALNSSVNDFKENNEQEHTALQKSINDNKAELQSNINNVSSAVQTLELATYSAIETFAMVNDEAHTELRNTINTKANVDHTHPFSAITGSIPITDSRITGNLPATRVTGVAPAPTVTKTANAVWIETRLSNGETLLEGFGSAQFLVDSQTVTVTLPKRVKRLHQYQGVIQNTLYIDIYGSVTINGIMAAMLNSQLDGLAFLQNVAVTSFCKNSDKFYIMLKEKKTTAQSVVLWHFSGILA